MCKHQPICLFPPINILISIAWIMEELSKAIRWSGLSATDTWDQRFYRQQWKCWHFYSWCNFVNHLKKCNFINHLKKFWKSPQKMQFCTGWQVPPPRAAPPLSGAPGPACSPLTSLAWKVKVVDANVVGQHVVKSKTLKISGGKDPASCPTTSAHIHRFKL